MDEIQALTNEIKQWRDGQQEQIIAIRKLLLGNGNVGLCETVRKISSEVKAVWVLVGFIGSAILAGVIKLIFFT
jgi:hypothetical protein